MPACLVHSLHTCLSCLGWFSLPPYPFLLVLCWQWPWLRAAARRLCVPTAMHCSSFPASGGFLLSAGGQAFYTSHCLPPLPGRRWEAGRQAGATHCLCTALPVLWVLFTLHACYLSLGSRAYNHHDTPAAPFFTCHLPPASPCTYVYICIFYLLLWFFCVVLTGFYLSLSHLVLPAICTLVLPTYYFSPTTCQPFYAWVLVADAGRATAPLPIPSHPPATPTSAVAFSHTCPYSSYGSFCLP